MISYYPGSLNVIENDTIQSSTHDFLLTFHSNQGYWHQWADEKFGDPPQGGSRSLQWSETGMEDPKRTPLAVYCFCV